MKTDLLEVFEKLKNDPIKNFSMTSDMDIHVERKKRAFGILRIEFSLNISGKINSVPIVLKYCRKSQRNKISLYMLLRLKITGAAA